MRPLDRAGGGEWGVQIDAPSLDPGTEKRGRIKEAAQAGSLAEGAREFGWDTKEGKAGMKFSEGRGWETERTHSAQGREVPELSIGSNCRKVG